MKYDFLNRSWILQPHLQPLQNFLYYSSIVNLPKELGMFLLGGTDQDNNFSRRSLFFSKYKKFFEKPPMLTKRAFFPTVFSMFDQSLYVLGGQDGMHDLDACERFQISENAWRPISSMTKKRNGNSAMCIDSLIFTFGGNNLDAGTLDTIERYMVEYDRWDVIPLKLRHPLHDSICFNLGGARVLLFGGQSQVTDRAGGGQQGKNHFDIYDLTMECLGEQDNAFAEGRTYSPGAYEPTMGLFHGFLGYLDDASLVSAPVNVKPLMCTCRQVEVTIGKYADPKLDYEAIRLAD